MWRDYTLGSTISKTTEDINLYKSERGIVKTQKNTLAIPINLEDSDRGYIFNGCSELILDTIVETDEGAIGKPIERELSKPFLMIGDSDMISKHLSQASEEDLLKFGYKEQQEFLDAAEDLFNRFFRRERIHGRHRFKHPDGIIFAFQSQTSSKLDILIAKGSKLVYASKEKVFVAHRNKIVMKSPEAVVCSNNGKSVIVNKDSSIVIKKNGIARRISS